ncbi:hypothetical protein PM082_000640 [Marasmius tenuissimus]|nr:hypothetical protein PM082_000640 [Marasmius tenuissimus]
MATQSTRSVPSIPARCDYTSDSDVPSTTRRTTTTSSTSRSSASDSTSASSSISRPDTPVSSSITDSTVQSTIFRTTNDPQSMSSRSPNSTTTAVPLVPSQESQKRKASTGMIVGIVFGVITAVLIVGVLGATFLRRRRRAVKQEQELSAAPFYGVRGSKESENGTTEFPTNQTAIDHRPSQSLEKTKLSESPLAPTRSQPVRTSSDAASAAIPDPPLPPLRRKSVSQREEALQRRVDMLLRENALLTQELYPPSYHAGSL